MPVIELPDGQTAEFPDTMSLDQIKSVLRAKFPPANASQPQQEAPQDQNLLQKAGGVAQKYVNAPIQDLMRQADEMASGAFQGGLNILPGVANLGIKGVNALTGNRTPEYKGFHFAPHTANAMAGELGSYFVPGKALTIAGDIPKVAHAMDYMRNIPQVANVTQKAQNAISRVPGLETILNALGHTASGALQGAVYNPENQGMGAAFGGGGNALGQAVGKAFPFAMNKLGFGQQPGRELIENMATQDVMPTVEAAQRLGTPLRPSEASQNPFVAGQEGRFLRTSEAAQENVTQGMQRTQQEKNAIRGLLDTIWDKSTASKNNVRSLYTQAYKNNLAPDAFNALKADPLIGDAINTVGKDKAWQRKLNGAPENNYAYLDKVRKELGDQEQKLLRAGERSKAAEYTEARQDLTKTMDDLAPEYKQARAEAERSITRSKIQKKMRQEEIRGSDFYNKIIKNDEEYNKLLHSLRNVPEAQTTLKDMKQAWHSLINIEKPSTSSYQSEKALNQARGSLQKIMELGNQLFGKKKNLESVKFMRDMDTWTRELQAAKQTGNKKEIDKALSSIFGKAFAEATPNE